ncbi:hypothetical protein GCM10007301_19040 [Azorhizobium oxalatiphilum]|uniref:Uncharacterized protein n=1 Tax=Azorhizobium oxalatiphilum TaxID=980631 RepID=A0A917F896_9HYPH|nr:hypothetical protein GCM10007301_19040 [Azorhizobium oxalatiphilum]
MAGALNKSGQAGEVRALLTDFAGHFYSPPRHATPTVRLSALVSVCPALFVPLIEAAIAAGQMWEAAWLMVDFHRDQKGTSHEAGDALFAAAAADPRLSGFGPFCYDRRWIMERQLSIAESPELDRRYSLVRKFDAQLLEMALLAKLPERAASFLDARLPAYRDSPVEDGHNFGFDAVCLLAVLGRHEEALALARHLARTGYDLMWRFDLVGAESMAWTQDMRQNEWLGALAATPAYEAFLREELKVPKLALDDPASVPLASVRDGELGGKKKARCFVSRKLIQPGAPVVKFRVVAGSRCGDNEETASRAAFDASGWGRSRVAFEADRVLPALMFPHPGAGRSKWHSPSMAAFCHDAALNPDGLDITRAARLIAQHAPPPVRHEWVKGPAAGQRVATARPFAGDGGHGEAANLLWRLVKIGLGEALLAAVSALPEEQADKVFALASTMRHPLARKAAATHFAAPDLPDVMDTAFKSRLTLADHLTVADFGSANPRFRAGLLAAFEGYALHLYSNYHPGVDWYLQEFQHYSLAGGSRLLFFLIHHADEEPVMATMLEQGWLPNGEGAGAYDAYGNSRRFLVRTVAMHLALHAPEKLDAFWGRDWVGFWCDTSLDRETERMLKALKAGKRR